MDLDTFTHIYERENTNSVRFNDDGTYVYHEGELLYILKDGVLKWIVPTIITQMQYEKPKFFPYDTTPHLKYNSAAIKTNIENKLNTRYDVTFVLINYSTEIGSDGRSLCIRFSISYNNNFCAFFTIITSDNMTTFNCNVYSGESEITNILEYSYMITYHKNTITELKLTINNTTLVMNNCAIEYDPLGKFQFKIGSTYIDLIRKSMMVYKNASTYDAFTQSPNFIKLIKLFSFVQFCENINGIYYVTRRKEPMKDIYYKYCTDKNGQIKTFINEIYLHDSVIKYVRILIGNNQYGFNI